MKTLDHAPISTRRTFLKTLGAGLMIAVAAPTGYAQPAPRQRRGGGGGGGGGRPVDIAARIHIGKDGTITVLTGKVECGQGARATIAQAAAEELGVPVASIQLIMGDTSLCPDDGGTFGSGTTPRTIPSVRQGAAGARAILATLAGQKLGVAASQTQVIDGKVIHGESGRKIAFGDLVGDDAANVFATTRPAGVAEVKAVKEWKVLGTPTPRNDARDLVTGGHKYPADIQRPGMWYGKVLRPPAYGAKLTSIDVDVAKAFADAVVVHEDDFVGVAAASSFVASQVIDALAKTGKWTDGNGVSSGRLYDHLKETARGGPTTNPFSDDLAKAHQSLREEYHIAYVQHAPMEPRAAVAEWADGSLTVWTGTQNPFAVRGELQSAFNLSPQTARVIVPDFGGGFGGKHSGECAVEAARLAKAAGKPVSLRWTREEEFSWAYFRPAGVILAEAGLDAAGRISSWYFLNINSGPSGVQTPYEVGGSNQSRTTPAAAPLKQGSYRGLAATANHFARECFMDELATAAGVDPLAFRLSHLKDERLIAVLRAAADQFGFANRWKEHDPNVGVGIACGTEKGSYLATCAEVFVDPRTRAITVRHVCQAYECGKILNPAGLMSQVQGAIMMGLGPALREEIQFDKGVVTNGTFADYLVPRMDDLPEMDIHLLDRPDLPPAGAGETPIVGIAPAIANAVFHVTGRRIRQMPIRLA